MTTSTPPVPDLPFAVQGWRFGGQYTDEHDFEVVMRAEDSITLYLRDDDCEIDCHVLNAEQINDLLRMLSAPKETCSVPGLGRELQWTLGDHLRGATLREHHLEEIGEWLKYATKEKQWPADEDTWEY